MTDIAPFVPALIIVDFQNDFCPPDGALAVPSGRTIAPPINQLLRLPFALRIATKDWHPKTHISFASNHPPPNNISFSSSTTIANPENASETESTPLWPDHCIQHTSGAELVSELDTELLDFVLEKGQDERVEQFSAFGTAFKAPPMGRTDLARRLREKGVTDVFVAGLALEFCVKCTAVDAAREGFRTWVVREATRGVDESAETMGRVREAFEEVGVQMISVDGEEVGWVREQGTARR